MASPARPPRREEEARLERAIQRVLASAPQPTQRPKAIFRVVPAGARFEYTRTLIGSGATAVERYGPFETERAAHALAKRAAARFAAENPCLVVGVIGLEETVRRELPVSTRFRAESVAVGQAMEPPTCATCGKPTRIWHGKPQRYCSKINGRNPCREAVEEKRRQQDPSLLAAKRERQRARYARQAATPEGKARLREKWRRRDARRADGTYRPPPPERSLADPAHSGVVPACIVCGEATHFYYGNPVRFCPRKPGEKRSACQVIHQNLVYRHKLKTDPEVRDKHNEQARLRRRGKGCRKNWTPEAWAKHLARNRAYKKRIRAARRPTEALPTGSVLATASPRTEGFDLLSRLYAAVPTTMAPAERMEVISEAALLVLDGAEISAAVPLATKSVRKNASRLRWAKPIEDCFWLADETQFIPEMHL